tara:strand:+ start:1332 stop:1634 length:303 start_codon:yes stop_codon:yes gene_type:complete
MEEFVEIGALVAKSVGDGVYEKIYNLDGVEYVFLETGRSNDLFSDRQFGEYGEAALLSVVVKSKEKDDVFSQIFELLGLDQASVGLMFEEKPITQIKTYF